MDTERSNSTLNTPPTAIDNAPLPSDVLTLQAMIRELLDALKKEQHEREKHAAAAGFALPMQSCTAQKRNASTPMSRGSFAEMAPANDATEASETPAEPSPSEEVTRTKESHASATAVAKKLPDSLVRVRTEHTLSEAERLCPCCNEVCQKFGEEISEQLDFKPGNSSCVNTCASSIRAASATTTSLLHACPSPSSTKACRGRACLPTSPPASTPIICRCIGSNAFSPGTTSSCRVRPCATGWPTLRRCYIRSSISWRRSCAGRSMHTDATKMPYLDPEVKGRSLSGQMWAYIGDRDHPFDVFALPQSLRGRHRCVSERSRVSRLSRRQRAQRLRSSVQARHDH